MFEKWAKTSGPPPSCSMKPKPFSELNHLTVPVAMSHLLRGSARGCTPREPLRCHNEPRPDLHRRYKSARRHTVARALEVSGTTTATAPILARHPHPHHFPPKVNFWITQGATTE